jgi:LPXTG-site transpeptidase (sortase) family protein
MTGGWGGAPAAATPAGRAGRPRSQAGGTASRAWADATERAGRPRSQGARGIREHLLGTALLLAGLVVLLGAVGTLVYVPWREQQHLAQRPAGPRDDLPARWDALTAGGADGGVEIADAKALGEGPTWLGIPRIGVDAPVMAMGLQSGEYQVPSFDVGHHADSANPGQPGNSVYNGHLQTIDAGQVFARLHELRPGDLVYVYTASYRFDWVVERAHTVRNDERGFLQPTPEARVTLYTCAGSYDPRTHDYSHRLVVVGRLAQVVPRAQPPAAQS